MSVCPKGSFLLLNGPGTKNGETASISVPAETLSETLCVKFWYQMSGPSVPSLNLLVKTVCTLLKNLVLLQRGVFYFVFICLFLFFAPMLVLLYLL